MSHTRTLDIDLPVNLMRHDLPSADVDKAETIVALINASLPRGLFVQEGDDFRSLGFPHTVIMSSQHFMPCELKLADRIRESWIPNLHEVWYVRRLTSLQANGSYFVICSREVCTQGATKPEHELLACVIATNHQTRGRQILAAPFLPIDVYYEKLATPRLPECLTSEALRKPLANAPNLRYR